MHSSEAQAEVHPEPGTKAASHAQGHGTVCPGGGSGSQQYAEQGFLSTVPLVPGVWVPFLLTVSEVHRGIPKGQLCVGPSSLLHVIAFCAGVCLPGPP